MRKDILIIFIGIALLFNGIVSFCNLMEAERERKMRLQNALNKLEILLLKEVEKNGHK